MLLLFQVRRFLFGFDQAARRAALRHRFRRLLHGRRPARPPAAVDATFDQVYDTDTERDMPWRDTLSGRAADAYSNGHQPTSPDLLRLALARVSQPAEATFVDLGCGLGRALIVAGEFGFKRIVGVELSPDLLAGARANLEIVRRRFPTLPPIDLIENDAGNYVFPPGPLVLYLFNPFHPPVLRRVVTHLREALRMEPRPLHLVYLAPDHAGLFDACAELERDPGGDIELHNWRASLWRERAASRGDRNRPASHEHLAVKNG